MSLGLATSLVAAATLTGVATSSAGTTETEITDLVLTVGQDETKQNIAWYSPIQGEGEVQWASSSAIDGDNFPHGQAERSPADKTGETHDGRHFFHATMSGLEPQTDYVYRVGTDGAWSPPHEFSTGDFDAHEFSFVAFGDPQIGNSGDVAADRDGWDQTLAAAIAAVPDAAFALSLGDQVQDAADEDQYAALLSPDTLTTLPFAFNLGNHDVDSSAYETHFHLPGDSDNPGYFWFTYSDVLVIGVDSNTFDVDAYDEFIGEVLDQHGDDAHWHIVTLHHTAFGVAEYSTQAELIELRGQIAPVISKHGVDMVLMGHDHAYSRTHLMDGREPVPADDEHELHPSDGDAVYVTLNSSSGSAYYQILPDEELDAADPNGFDYAQTAWQEEAPTYTRVDVTPESLTVATVRTDSGDAIDEFVLHHPEGAPQTSDNDQAPPSPSPSAADAGADDPTTSPTAEPQDQATGGTDDQPPAAAILAIVAGLVVLAAAVTVLVRRKADNGGLSQDHD